MPTTLAATARPAGHLLVEALIEQGIDTVFGVPGESFLAVLDGFHEHRDRIRFISCRHEGGASFMAEAAGKLGPRPGVCIVTRGPGASNAAIGLHTAFQDSTPLVLLIGQVGSDHRDREAFQEVDYRQMFGPGTLGMAKWVAEVDRPERLPEYLSRAFHVAMQGRPGPVVLALPEDMLRASTPAAVLPRVEPVHAWPAPGDLRQLRELLLTAQRPLLLVGGSGWSAESTQALQRFAENWQLPVSCSFRFQDSFDNLHPQYAGDVGIGINPALAKAVGEADLLVVIGARLGEMTTGGYELIAAPRPAQRLVHLHAGPEELGRVYLADLLMQSSLAVAGKALEGIAAPLAVPWANWTERLHLSYLASLESTPAPGAAVDLAIDLAQVARCVARLAPPDTVYTNGAGNHTGWLHRYVPYRGRHLGGRTQLAPTSGAMGYGLPAAVAASLLAPGRCVVHWAGDGDLLMTGQEMITAMAYGAGRAPGALVSIVVDNASYGTIRMHQERHYPDRVVASPLLNPDFVLLARAYGWQAERIECTADFEPAFAQALVAGTPVLLHLPVSVDQLTTRSSLAAIRRAAIAQQPSAPPSVGGRRAA
jgi:acetolactate synthase-1/2/3 large subunit